MTCRQFSGWFAALACLVPALPVPAQAGGDVSFTIRFSQGQMRYHVGERIPIEMSLTSSSPKTFAMDTRAYDRSGRLDLEQFHVSPAGRDPLERYFGDQMGRMGGGAGGTAELSTTPQTLDEDLNEWVALDTPGHYTVYVTSDRVAREAANANTTPLHLTSNSLEFDVVAADPAWQRQVVFGATAWLENPGATEADRTAALRTLRFLDTRESAAALVRELGRAEYCWDCAAGLAGSAHPAVAVKALEVQFAAPEYSISGRYLEILTILTFALQHEPLPAYPAAGGAKQQRVWVERMHRRNESQARLEDEFYRRAEASVGTKYGRARAATINTLLTRPNVEAGGVQPLRGIGGEEVAEAFLALTEQEQDSLLMSFWERLKMPAIVPALKEVARAPEMDDSQLRDLALRRLYELDRKEAEPLLRAEIERPHVDGERYTVKGATLGLLPEKTLPQYDSLLARRLEAPGSRTVDLDAELVGRFATKAILARVKAVYAGPAGQCSCVASDGFELYFLRVDADFGVEQMRRAPSACMVHSLPALVAMKRWAEVEPAIVAGLDNPDLQRAGQAAHTLALYGGPKAEAAMWRRLQRFHAQWGGKEKEVGLHGTETQEVGKAIEFGYALVGALGQAQGWVLEDAQLKELEGMAFGVEKQNVRGWRWNGPLAIRFNPFYEGKLSVVINGGYMATTVENLRQKLAQFPEGTWFKVIVFGDEEKLGPALEAVREAAVERGLRVDGP